MKVNQYIFARVLFITSLTLIGCKDDSVDPKVVALNAQLAVLTNGGSSWVLASTGSVMKDDVDVSSQFAGFKLTVGNKTYTTQKSLSHVWKASGTWDFKNDNPNLILKDGGVEVSVNHSSSGLTLTFAAGNSTGARGNSISGKYVFRLVSE
jgi:hypothetical protein